MSNHKYNSYAFAAHQEAKLASIHAQKARVLKSKRANLEQVLNREKELFSNSMVIPYTFFFMIAFVVDILVSWEIYRDILTVSSLEPSLFFILMVALLINALAAIASHYLGKTASAKFFYWHLDYFIQVTKKGDYPEELAIREMLILKRRELITFVIMTLFTLSLVVFISFQRVFLQKMGQENMVSETESYDLIQKIAPILFIMIEIYCGMFLFEVLQYIRHRSSYQNLTHSFNYQLQRCQEHDKLAFNLVEHAKSKKEIFEFQKDLFDSVQRVQKRTFGDNYVDLFEKNQITFLIRDINDCPVVRTQVFGFFEAHRKVISGFTNTKGFVEIQWFDEEEYLDSIEIEGIKVKGPFAKDKTHLVRLPLKSNSMLRLEN